MAEQQLREILDQLAHAHDRPHPPAHHNDRATRPATVGPASVPVPVRSASTSPSRAGARAGTSPSPISSIASSPRSGRPSLDDDRDPKRRLSTAQSLLSSLLHPSIRPPTPPSPASTRLNSLFDMLSLSARRKVPPALDLAKLLKNQKSHEESSDEEQEGLGLHDSRDSGSVSDITSPTDTDLHESMSLEQQQPTLSTQRLTGTPSSSSTDPQQHHNKWAAAVSGTKRVRFSEVVIIVN